jgi:hypothetical protein
MIITLPSAQNATPIWQRMGTSTASKTGDVADADIVRQLIPSPPTATIEQATDLTSVLYYNNLFRTTSVKTTALKTQGSDRRKFSLSTNPIELVQLIH